jgi:hypothetical protein
LSKVLEHLRPATCSSFEVCCLISSPAISGLKEIARSLLRAERSQASSFYDREAQEVPIQRTDVARRAGIVIRRRHPAEPFAPVRSVGGFQELKRYPSSSPLRHFIHRLGRCLTVYEQLRTRDSGKSRATGKPNRGYAFVAPTDVCGRTDVHSGAGSRDLSGVQW